MSFKIHPLTPTDRTTAFNLADLSFARFNALLHTSYPPSAESQKQLEKARLATIPILPQARMFKAVDDKTGRIIGVSRWIVVDQDAKVTESVEDLVEEVLERKIPETNVPATRGLYAMAAEEKRNILGVTDKDGQVLKLRRHIELEALFTHPEHQGKGVGKTLLQWGIDEAERLGVDIYLEATEEGRPLYDRFGFEAVHGVDFDAGQYGG